MGTWGERGAHLPNPEPEPLNGGGGIRTHVDLSTQRLSRAPPLATRPPLQGIGPLRSNASGRSSSPAWARTRTLLIQSQTCCQLHHGATLSNKKPKPREGSSLGQSRATSRNRTDDPVITSDVLYHLSYGGVTQWSRGESNP